MSSDNNHNSHEQAPERVSLFNRFSTLFAKGDTHHKRIKSSINGIQLPCSYSTKYKEKCVDLVITILEHALHPFEEQVWIDEKLQQIAQEMLHLIASSQLPVIRVYADNRQSRVKAHQAYFDYPGELVSLYSEKVQVSKLDRGALIAALKQAISDHTEAFATRIFTHNCLRYLRREAMTAIAASSIANKDEHKKAIKNINDYNDLPRLVLAAAGLIEKKYSDPLTPEVTMPAKVAHYLERCYITLNVLYNKKPDEGSAADTCWLTANDQCGRFVNENAVDNQPFADIDDIAIGLKSFEHALKAPYRNGAGTHGQRLHDNLLDAHCGYTHWKSTWHMQEALVKESRAVY